MRTRPGARNMSAVRRQPDLHPLAHPVAVFRMQTGAGGGRFEVGGTKQPRLAESWDIVLDD